MCRFMTRRQPVPELKRLTATRIVATPPALDEIIVPANTVAMRFAPDELFLTPATPDLAVADAYAIVIEEGGYAGISLAAAAAKAFLERSCEWAIPTERPVFVQGKIAGIPAKVYLEENAVLFIVPAAYAHDFQERMS
jgi:hypothetical protein